MSNDKPTVADRPPQLSYWPCPDTQAKQMGKVMGFDVWMSTYIPEIDEPQIPSNPTPFVSIDVTGVSPFPTIHKIYDNQKDNGRCLMCNTPYSPSKETLVAVPPFEMLTHPEIGRDLWESYVAGHTCLECLLSGMESMFNPFIPPPHLMLEKLSTPLGENQPPQPANPSFLGLGVFLVSQLVFVLALGYYTVKAILSVLWLMIKRPFSQ